MLALRNNVQARMRSQPASIPIIYPIYLMDIAMPDPVEANFEYYIEEFEIVEMRDGSVYKTKSLGYKWIRFNELHCPPEGTIYASPSTSVMRELLANGQGTIRRIKS